LLAEKQESEEATPSENPVMRENRSTRNAPASDKHLLYDPDPFSWAMLALAALSAAGGLAGIAAFGAYKKDVKTENRRRLREKTMHMMDLIRRLRTEIDHFTRSFGPFEEALHIQPGIEFFAPLPMAMEFRRIYAAIAHLAVEIEDQKTAILAELMSPPWNFDLQEYVQFKSEEFIDALNRLRTERKLSRFGELADRYLSLLERVLSDQVDHIG
jgi:hypothetical protein